MNTSLPSFRGGHPRPAAGGVRMGAANSGV